MNWPYELQIGWRYTRAGRAGRRNGFISFISGVSMLGIALGVAALIIVLSVMNGFQKEVRDRMLSVVSHIEIFAPQGAALPDQVFLRVYGPEEPVGREEPTGWSAAGPQIYSDLVFDWFEIHINSQTRQTIDEVRLGTTWASVTAPWVGAPKAQPEDQP